MGKKFGDYKFHQKKVLWAAKLTDLMFALVKVVPHPHNKDMILRFKTHISPNKLNDPGALPYAKEWPCRNFNRMECLMAHIRMLVITWWVFVENKTDGAQLLLRYDHLHDIAKWGLDYYELTGDLKKGYKLSKIKGDKDAIHKT